MKLRAILSLQPADMLHRIAANTHLPADPGGNKSVVIDLLCRHLPSATGAQMKSLDAEQQAFVIGLAAEGGELLEMDAVVELSDGFDRRFQSMCRSLAETGLVFQDAKTLGADAPLVGIPDTLLKSISVPPADTGRLRDIMKSTSIGLLRAFARDLHLTLKDPRRPFVVQAIRNRLLNLEGLKAYLNSLSDDQKALLDRVLKGGAATMEDVQSQSCGGTAKELAEMLWKTPLFFLPEGPRNRNDAPVLLATDLRRVLSDLADAQGGQLERPPAESLTETSESPSEIRDNTPHLLRDLATLLGLVEQRRPRLLKRGGMARGDMREIGKFCQGDSDPGYLEFLTLFIQTSGMSRPEGRVWRLAEGALERFLQEDELLKALFDMWQETRRWNEWAAERSTPSDHGRMEEMRALRREVVGALCACPEGGWISYPRFYRMLTQTSKPFRHLAENPASGRTLASRNVTADELLRRMLRGALSWAGVIRLGNPSAFSLPLHRASKAVFQISPAGRHLLQGKAPERFRDGGIPSNPDARFVLQPNLEILSPPDLPFDRYIRLCSLTNLKTIDVMARFEISRETVHRAMARGISGKQIREFFRAYGATGVPQIVETLIQECETKLGEIEIGPSAGYLTVVRESLLDELYAQKRVAAHLGPRLSPVAAALGHHAKPEALLQILHNQGYMPRLNHEIEGGENGRHQLVLSSAELSELVGFLETALESLHECPNAFTEEMGHLLKRLRRGLRRVPDQHRQEAISRFRKAFEGAAEVHRPDNGMRDLLHYTGENPASQPSDIRPLIAYAIDHRLCVELGCGSDQAARRTVEPVSEGPTMLYAFCRDRKGDRVFSLDKIHFARLTGERF